MVLRFAMMTFLSLVSILGFAQVKHQPLSEFNFNEGGYSLLVFPNHYSDKDDLVYHTSNQDILKALNGQMIVTKEAVTYPFACNDGLNLFLQKRNQIVKTLAIRYRCHALIENGNYWDYSGLGFAVLLSRMDTAKMVKVNYNNLNDAREDYSKKLTNDSLIVVEEPEWFKYDGYFYLRYPNPNVSGRAPFTEWETLTSKVRKEITDKYSDHKFEVALHYYGHGENYPTVLFKVSAKSDFYSQFEAYPITSGWKPFKPELIIYTKY